MGVAGGSSLAGGARNKLRVILFQQLLRLVIAGGVLQVCTGRRVLRLQHLHDLWSGKCQCMFIGDGTGHTVLDIEQQCLAWMQESVWAA